MSDTFTDFLKRGIGPRQGMQRIPFPTESYQHPSKPLSAKRLLNLYSETEPSDARSQAALISTPGLVFRENLNGGPVVQFNTELLGGFYAVSGGHAFRNIAGVTSDLGAVGTPVDPLTDPTRLMTTIACSPTDVVICVPPNAFTATHIGALAPVAGGFPGANSVCFQDGYFVYSQTGDGTQWFISHLDDPTLYDALDFATLEGMNNVIMRSVTHRGELWHLGYAGIEVWYDAGGLAITGTDFPFLRRSGAIIPYGVEPRSVALKVDGSIFWVSVDGIVYRSQGYAALRVSTHAIEAIIETSFPNLAVGFTYTQLGHIFYGFTLTDIGRTLVYDCATKEWADRSSDINGNGPWRATVAGQVGPRPYIGDASGNLYAVDPDVATDAGVLVARQATLPSIYNPNRQSMNRVEVEMEAGGASSPGNVLLDWSDDGGNIFRAPRVMSAGTILETKKRVFTNRLGSFRERVLRVTTHGKTTLYAVDADITNPLAGG